MVGTVADGDVVVPSGMRYVSDVAAGIVVAEVVGSDVAAFFGADSSSLAEARIQGTYMQQQQQPPKCIPATVECGSVKGRSGR